MALLVLTIVVAVLSRGVASYGGGGYSVHDEIGGQDDHTLGGLGGKKFNAKLEVVHGPHEHIEVKGYSTKLEELGQHVEIPEAPIKVIRVTKTVAIKVPVPYPVRIKEKVPYPVTVHKPYPVPVPQIVKVPYAVHTKQTEQKKESAPVWPSKEHGQSEYSEYDEGDDSTAKVSHGGGGGGGGYGAPYSYGGGDGQQGLGGHQSFGGYSNDAGTGAGAAYLTQQYGQDHSGGSVGDFGGYHSAAAAPSGYGGGGGDIGQHGNLQQYNFQPESNSYDAAIQDYLAKMKSGGGQGDSYAGSYGGGNALGIAPSSGDDYHRVHEVETTNVDRVSYDH